MPLELKSKDFKVHRQRISEKVSSSCVLRQKPDVKIGWNEEEQQRYKAYEFFIFSRLEITEERIKVKRMIVTTM